MAVARGDALAIRGDRRLRADVLTAHFSKAGGATQAAAGGEAGERSSKMERIEAYGNVFVSTPTDIVRGDRGTYHMDRGIATVTGKLQIGRAPCRERGSQYV